MSRVLLAVAAVILAGCGVPLQSEPEVIDPGIGPELPVEVPATNGRADGAIYLVRGDSLVAVARDATTQPSDTLEQLLAGPAAAEAQAGLRTAIPISSVIREVTLADGLATVDVSSSFGRVGGQEEILAIAQLVLTLTTTGVDRVTVLLDGLPVALPLPNGVLVTDPVTFADYQVLVDQ
jgi:spore germination protein GerM